MGEAERKQRRWNVILSGFLIAALTIVVTFTSRANFLSPTSVIVVAAVGVVALMLQLRFRYKDIAGAVHIPMWLNVLGVLFALVAFFGDSLKIASGTAEVVALIAVGCFGISGALVLHEMRKQRISPK